MTYINRYKQFQFFTDTFPPADLKAIKDFEKQFSLVIPDVHKEFLQLYNGACTDYGRLYGIDDIAEMYECNQLAEYTPGYICIGGDHGDYEFLMESKADAQSVYYIDAGALNAEDIRAGEVFEMTSIFEWLTKGDGEDPGDPYDLFEEEDDGAFYARVDVELVHLPSGGLAELYQLLDTLGLAVSPKIVMEYQKSLLPRIIAEGKLAREIEPGMGRLKDPGAVRIIYHK